MLRLVVAGLVGALAMLPGAYANEHKTYGAELEGFDYPYEVHRFQFKSQGEDLAMAYMDVVPQQPNGRTAVLLHGRNFCAATWETSLKVLSQAGYRVIFDATHSVQRPGGAGNSTSGDGALAPILARAAMAAGCDGIFMEVHENPARALSDGATQLQLKDLPKHLRMLKAIHAAVSGRVD